MSVFFLPKLVDLLGPLIYFDMSYFQKNFWDVVKVREESGLNRGDYIDSILKLKNAKQEDLYSEYFLNSEVIIENLKALVVLGNK